MRSGAARSMTLIHCIVANRGNNKIGRLNSRLSDSGASLSPSTATRSDYVFTLAPQLTFPLGGSGSTKVNATGECSSPRRGRCGSSGRCVPLRQQLTEPLRHCATPFFNCPGLLRNQSLNSIYQSEGASIQGCEYNNSSRYPRGMSSCATFQTPAAKRSSVVRLPHAAERLRGVAWSPC